MKYAPAVLMLLGGLVIAAAPLLPSSDPAAVVVQVTDAEKWDAIAARVEANPDRYPDTDKLVAVVDRLGITDTSRLDNWRAKNQPIAADNLPSILFTLRGAPDAP
jgi:hypothetical protein